MSSIVFDTGPIITLTTNNLLWLLEEMKKHYDGDFVITSSVHRELIDRPLTTKKFKFEALQVLRCVKDNVLTVLDDKKFRNEVMSLLDIANNSFFARGKPMRIVHYAEISSLVAAMKLKADAFVVDERTTRLLIENPPNLKKVVERHLHMDVKLNSKKFSEFKKKVKDIKPIRSIEMITVAFEMGLLDKYLPPMEDSKKVLLQSLLWGSKLNGCAVSTAEIDRIVALEKL
ncbi:hypothetical protein ACFLZX_03515 [Nanoarchaeota archaeon]